MQDYTQWEDLLGGICYGQQIKICTDYIFHHIFNTCFPWIRITNVNKKIYPSSALYSLLSSSCKNGGRDINIGIIDDLDEPFRIKFDNYISGIESDYLITILPCDKDNIRYISYTSIDELKRAMDDDLIQFSIAGSGFDDTDYKR